MAEQHQLLPALASMRVGGQLYTLHTTLLTQRSKMIIVPPLRVAHIWPFPSQVWPTLVDFGPHLADIRAKLTELGPGLIDCGAILILADFGPNFAD